MNERIEKLANVLGPIATIGNWGRVEWKDNVYPQLGDKLYAAIDLQKFAELIVIECATLARNKSEFITQQAGLYAEDRDEHTSAKASAWQFKVFELEIRRHFGVYHEATL